MGVRLAPLTSPGLSPSYPRRACPRESVGRASRLVAVGLPNQRLDSAFAGMTKLAPFNARFWVPLENVNLLMTSLVNRLN